MKLSNGYFIVSLDFELFWGLFDVKKLDDYKENLAQFLFAQNKEELIEFLPKQKPSYKNKKFDPYRLINDIGMNEVEDPYHFGNSLINKIKENSNHEIATHTFSHYYVNEQGQSLEQFEADLLAAIEIALKKGISLKTIVFPRNQINNDYLKICEKHGIISYRGIEKNWMFNTYDTKLLESPLHKAFRLLDSYINLSGHNTYSLNNNDKSLKIINMPSSRFFRPYNKSLRVFENQRLSRIKKGMSHAAKKNEIYHLWWHPHNFGKNIEENFNNLEKLFKHYSLLNKQYNFGNDTMSNLTKVFKTD